MKRRTRPDGLDAQIVDYGIRGRGRLSREEELRGGHGQGESYQRGHEYPRGSIIAPRDAGDPPDGYALARKDRQAEQEERLRMLERKGDAEKHRARSNAERRKREREARDKAIGGFALDAARGAKVSPTTPRRSPPTCARSGSASGGRSSRRRRSGASSASRTWRPNCATATHRTFDETSRLVESWCEPLLQ